MGPQQSKRGHKYDKRQQQQGRELLGASELEFAYEIDHAAHLL